MKTRSRLQVLLGIGMLLVACTQAEESSGTVATRPLQATSTAASSLLLPSDATSTPLPALAPPAPTDLAAQASPTRTEATSPTSIASIVERERASLTLGATMNLLPAVRPEPVSVAYTSELRPVDPGTMGFLWQFGDSFGQPDFASQFQRELFVREGELELWMPVREPLVTSMVGDLADGQQVTLFVRLLGSLETDERLEIIFVITDFHE